MLSSFMDSADEKLCRTTIGLNLYCIRWPHKIRHLFYPIIFEDTNQSWGVMIADIKSINMSPPDDQSEDLASDMPICAGVRVSYVKSVFSEARIRQVHVSAQMRTPPGLVTQLIYSHICTFTQTRLRPRSDTIQSARRTAKHDRPYLCNLSAFFILCATVHASFQHVLRYLLLWIGHDGCNWLIDPTTSFRHRHIFGVGILVVFWTGAGILIN